MNTFKPSWSNLAKLLNLIVFEADNVFLILLYPRARLRTILTCGSSLLAEVEFHSLDDVWGVEFCSQEQTVYKLLVVHYLKERNAIIISICQKWLDLANFIIELINDQLVSVLFSYQTTHTLNSCSNL